MRYPLDNRIKTLQDIPYTISYIIRKRQQVDSLSELTKDKRPDDELIWDGSSEELDQWLERVFSGTTEKNVELNFAEYEIER